MISRNSRPDGRDAGLILAVWLPVEFGWLRGGLWAVAGTALLVYVYGFRRPPPVAWKLGARARITLRDVSSALIGLAVLAAALVPLGAALGFLRVGYRALPVRYYLFIPIYALIEEILFRGVIQNLAELRVGKIAALLGTAALFGLAHVNNPSPGFGIPNVRYVIMASVAGIVYGAVWIRTRNVFASALTHSGVNLLWKLFFAAT